jgi:thymidylate synthase
MQQYLELGSQILGGGMHRENRTAVPTTAIFGTQMRFDLTDGKLALVTTKKIHLKSIIHELLWMISGSTNVRYLQENGVTIWDEWADENGELGPVYGAQWRRWQDVTQLGMGIHVTYIDQLANLINALRHNPHDRRMIVSAWNVARIKDMKLPPCHMMFQCFSHESESGERLLSLQIYQRSVDFFLGLPFNLAFYSILCHMLAAQTGHKAYELIHVGGDVHIYDNHVEQVKLQLTREPKERVARLALADRPSIDSYVYDDVTVDGYVSHPVIKGAVAV